MRGLCIVPYGSEGVGKTSFGLQFARLGPLKVISVRESGYEDLADARLVQGNIEHVYANDWDDIETESMTCKAKTLLVDSTSGMQELLFEHVCNTKHNGDWAKFTDYWKGQRTDSPPVLAEYLSKLDVLRNKGTNIVIIGHMTTEEEPNTMGANYLCHKIDLDKKVRSVLTKWAQMILFLNIDVNINIAVESDKKKTITLGKAKDTDSRIIWTEKAPGHDAKNRCNLKNPIQMGSNPKEAFENFYNALPVSYKTAQPLN